MQIRPATPADAAAIADIYNQGIEDRSATFETRLRTPDDIASWFDGIHPVVVAEDNGQVIGFASTSSYRPRDCYKGVAEVSAYVARKSRGRGPISKAELQRRLAEVVVQSHAALGKASAQELLRKRCIQGFDVTGLEAIFDSIPHFKGHTQEIVHMTRCVLGEGYKFAWVPSTPQEGA